MLQKPCGTGEWGSVRILVDKLPKNDATMQMGIDVCLGMLGLGWRLGTSTVEATVIFEEGCKLAAQSGDVPAVAALHGIYACVLGLVDGLSDEYVRHSREAIRLADQTQDTGLQIAQRAFFAFACVFAGRLSEGIESCANACTRYPEDPALGMAFTGYSPLLGIMMSQAWMLLFSGRIREGEVVRERAEQLAHLHADFEVSLWLHLLHHEMNILHADAAAARENARRAIAASEKCDTAQARHVDLIVLGTAHRLSARSAIDAAHDQHSRIDEIKANLALAHVLLGRADELSVGGIAVVLDRAGALIDETGAKLFQPDWHECRGCLAQLNGDLNTVRIELDLAQQAYAQMGFTAQVARLSNVTVA